MIIEKIEKLRRAPYPVRQRFLALVVVLSMGIITVIWFIFFVKSITSMSFQKSVAPSVTTTSVASTTGLKGPFDN